MHYVQDMARDVWTGAEWQSHCEKLLSMKHGTDIQFVPDRTEGDHGIEAFRLDVGIVYQCYSPYEHATAQAQTLAQKRKITTDLGKLYANRDGLMSMLGAGYKIERWVLLTPYMDDKELIKHARKKSDEIRSAADRPDWWCQNFRVAVYTDEVHFPEEILRLYAQPVDLALRSPIPLELDTANPAIRGMDEKLHEKLIMNHTLAEDLDALAGLKSSLLFEYVIGQVRVDELERKYMETWEAVSSRSKSFLRAFERERTLNPYAEMDSNSLAENLAAKLKGDSPGLPVRVCDELAWHFIASWWIQCPLKFREVS